MTDGWRTIRNPVTGEELTFIETAEESGGTRTVMLLTLEPGGAVMAHSHRVQETFEWVAGEPTVELDGNAVILNEGDALTSTPRSLHSVRNNSDAPATVRVTASPPGYIEEGLRTMFGLARDGRITERGMPKDPLVAALAAWRGGLYLPPLPQWLYWPLMGGLAAAGRWTGAERVIARYNQPRSR